MPSLILVLVFATVAATVWGLSASLLAGQWQIDVRLRRLRATASVKTPSDPLALPFRDRFLRPMWHGATTRMGRFAPRQLVLAVERRATLAGNPWSLSANEIVGLQICLGLAFGLFGGLLTGVATSPRPIAWAMLLAFVILGLYLPQFALSARISTRQREATEALPDTLDLLVVCVEAGLGFDAALQRVVEKTTGPLRDEFQRALNEVRFGKPRRQALLDMAARLDVADLSSFIRAVLQSDQLGVPIANVLRAQSDHFREVRSQRAEEQTMKVPIKMLFPMVMFILPVLLMIILGPAAIQVLRTIRIAR